MTGPRGPLPALNVGGRSLSTIGHWRGTVDSTSPLRVSVPGLLGEGAKSNVEVVAGLDPPLAAGARVWVSCIQGDPEWLLVTHHRD